GVLLAASTMGLVRGMVGFIAFLLAFWLRANHAPTWWFGLTLGSSAIAALGGAAMAPALRRVVREERIVLGCLIGIVLGALVASWIGGREGAVVVAAVVG